MHVPPLRRESGVLDVADDLGFVHAVARAGGPHDVFLDHHAAHVVGAVGQAQLPDLAALRHPRRLQVVEVVEDDARDRERAQVVEAGRLAAGELGVLGLIAPRDERGEAAGLVLQRAQPQQVLEALLVGLDRPVHHRRRRPQAGAMRVPHDVEPFVGRRLAVAVQPLADAVDENFGAAAGNAVEAGRHQAIDDRRHRQLREAREVNDFRRRERVQLEGGIALLDRAEQILVPRQRQVGIVTALEQQLHAADGHGLVDLSKQLVEAEHVPFRRSDRPIERAEVALRDADVGVVDVAVDDVGDDPFGMLAGADPVGQPAEQRRRRVPIELERLGGIDAPARANLRRDVFDRHGVAGSKRTRPTLRPCRRGPSDPPNKNADRSRYHANLRRVAIEQLEAGAFVGAKIVLDIIAQVPRAEVAVLWRIAEILARDGVALVHARITRRLERRDIVGGQQPRHGPPRTPRQTAGRSSTSTPRRGRSSGPALHVVRASAGF